MTSKFITNNYTEIFVTVHSFYCFSFDKYFIKNNHVFPKICNHSFSFVYIQLWQSDLLVSVVGVVIAGNQSVKPGVTSCCTTNHKGNLPAHPTAWSTCILFLIRYTQTCLTVCTVLTKHTFNTYICHITASRLHCHDISYACHLPMVAQWHAELVSGSRFNGGWSHYQCLNSVYYMWI